jgi:hypothetical protein
MRVGREMLTWVFMCELASFKIFLEKSSCWVIVNFEDFIEIEVKKMLG